MPVVIGFDRQNIGIPTATQILTEPGFIYWPLQRLLSPFLQSFYICVLFFIFLLFSLSLSLSLYLFPVTLFKNTDHPFYLIYLEFFSFLFIILISILNQIFFSSGAFQKYCMKINFQYLFERLYFFFILCFEIQKEPRIKVDWLIYIFIPKKREYKVGQIIFFEYFHRLKNLLVWAVYLFILLLFFFFFNEIECKKGRTRMMQPLWISKDPCITEEKGKLIKWEGGGVGVCARLRVLKVWRL